MSKNEPTGWVGWVYFAGAMMVLLGLMEAMVGLVALFKDSYYVVSQSGLVAFDYTTWGWIHLLLGVFVLLAGLAVIAGNAWGRVVGVLLAVLSGLAQLSFLSAYPLWSIIMIAIDVAVIYALTMHGAEAKAN